MSRPRSRPHLRSSTQAVAIVVFLVAVAFSLEGRAAIIRAGGGRAPYGQTRVAHGYGLEFDFQGRMPVGDRWVVVKSGHGSSFTRGAGYFPTTLVGTTASGARYEWSCGAYWIEIYAGSDPIDAPVVGGTRVNQVYLYDARCETAGQPRGFALKIFFYKTTDRSSYETNDYTGIYYAVLNDF